MDFGDCYTNIQEKNNINEELIVVISKKIIEESNQITSYSFYHPKTGDKLDTEICRNNTIKVIENLYSILSENMPNYESMLSLTKQGINIFNSSDEFYNDLCYDYELNGTKDVAYKDRLKVFYPNISLCDSGCKQIGVFLENMTAHFECDFKDLSNNNFNSIKDNVIFDELLGDYLSFFESSNLKVLKCAKKGMKYFTKFYGMYITYITLFSLGVSCILIASFYMIELSSLKVYI